MVGSKMDTGPKHGDATPVKPLRRQKKMKFAPIARALLAAAFRLFYGACKNLPTIHRTFEYLFYVCHKLDGKNFAVFCTLLSLGITAISMFVLQKCH
jgi:hypothetical protein